MQRWVNETPDLPQDEFIDNIPFPETQNYVKRILGTAEDYRRLYGDGARTPQITRPPTKAPAKKSTAAPTKKSTTKRTPAKRSTTSRPRKAAGLISAAMTSKVRGSLKLAAFSDSIFPEMTRLAQRYDAVNLSQGFPDFPAPAALKQAACDAILGDVNQYSISFGARSLREAVAAQFTRRHGVAVDAEEDVTICCGSTEAMLATMLACVDPGDEVIVFEPFYENYGPGAIMAGATPKYVKLSPPHWTFDPDQLAARVLEPHPRHRHQHADQSNRQGVHARRARR